MFIGRPTVTGLPPFAPGAEAGGRGGPSVPFAKMLSRNFCCSAGDSCVGVAEGGIACPSPMLGLNNALLRPKPPSTSDPVGVGVFIPKTGIVTRPLGGND